MTVERPLGYHFVPRDAGASMLRVVRVRLITFGN
jgi:hypothetical protein